MKKNGSQPINKNDLKTALRKVKNELNKKIEAVRADLRTAESGLNQKIDRVAFAVVDLQTEMRQVKETMATKNDVRQILTAIDRFASKGEAYDQKAISHGAILIDHEAALRDHGRRISHLESRP